MKKYGFLGFLVCVMASPVGAVSIGMRFVDVTLENVEPGASVNLRALRNLPLIVINKDQNEGTDILIEPVAPQAKELKEGYEPIPDPNWIRALPNRFHLGPKASASTDVLIDIPKDPKYIGHHYEGILYVHTEPSNRLLPNGGLLFRAGLRSRFRISIGVPGPATLQRERAMKKLASIDLNFSVTPDTLFTQDIPLGREVDLKTERKASLKIINQADEGVHLKVRSVPQDPNILPQSGYEYAPDPTWLQVAPQDVKLEGNSIREIKLKVTVPDKPQYHGKKYMFLIETTLADDSLPIIYNNTVYIATLP
jgi:hypothetical protein